MMKLVQIFYLMMFLVISQGALAVEKGYSIEGILPELKLTEQNEIQLVFADQRVAQVFYRDNVNKTIDFKLKFSSSDCDKAFKDISCQMQMWASHYSIQLLWVQHPDKSKIKTVVKDTLVGDNEILSYLDWSMNFWSNRDPKLNLFLEDLKLSQPTSIKCNKLDWLPDQDKFDLMSFEIIQQNLETEASEKKSLNFFKNVKFAKDKSANQITLTSIEPFHQSSIAYPYFNISPLGSENIFFTFKKNKKVCHYNTERDIANSLVLSIMKNKMSEYKAYKAQSLQEGVTQIGNFNDNEMKNYNWKLAKKRSELPLVVQLLDAFGIARVKYNLLNEKGDIDVQIKVLDIK